MLTLKQFIEFYCTEEREPNLFYGFTFFGDKVDFDIPKGFTLQTAWCDRQYRKVWISNEAKAIITYCEGDIWVRVFQTEEEYKKGLDECHEFYTRF